jgi:hypothetical protein
VGRCGGTHEQSPGPGVVSCDAQTSPFLEYFMKSEVITDQYSMLQLDWELALEAHKWTAVEGRISKPLRLV